MADSDPLIVQMRAQYLRALPEKIADLEADLGRLRSRPEDGNARAEMHTRLHNLWGSAGGYGFESISAAAREWCLYLKSLERGGTPPGPADLPPMRAFLDEMRKIVRSESSGMGAAEGAASARNGGRGRRGVLVTADPELAALIPALLRPLDLDLVLHAAAPPALDADGIARCDLLIVDWDLPGDGAREILRTLQERVMEIPVLLMGERAALTGLPNSLAGAAEEILPRSPDPMEMLSAAKRILAAEERRRSGKLRLAQLIKTSSKVAPGMTLEEILSNYLTQVPGVTPFRSAAVYLPSPDGERLRCVLSPGAGDPPGEVRWQTLQDAFEGGERMGAASFSLAGRRCSGSGRGALFSEKGQGERAWEEGDHLIAEVRSFTKIWGYLRVWDPSDGQRPDEATMRVLSLIAHRMADSLDCKEGFRSEVHIRHAQEAARGIEAAALRATGMDAIKGLVTKAAVERFGNAFACFLERDPASGEIRVGQATCRDGAETAPLLAPGALELVRRAVQSGQPAFLTNLVGGRGIVGRGSYLCSLALPVFTAEGVRDLLVVEDDARPEYSPWEVHLYASLAETVGMIWSRQNLERKLDLSRRELEQAYASLQTAHGANSRLEEVVRRYVPVATWEAASDSMKAQDTRPIEEIGEACVVYIDIADFNRIWGSLSPIHITGILNKYFTFLSTIVLQREGDVVRCLGDAVLATFKRGEMAIRAVDDILRGRRRLNRGLEESGGLEINLRIGAAFGPAILCRVGPFYKQERTLLGETVNAAFDLQKSAVPGTALLDSAVVPRGSAPEEFDVGKVGREIPFKVRGREAEVLTFRRDLHLYA